MKTTILIVLLLASDPGLFAQEGNKKEKISITDQEYAVYEAVGVGNYENETTGFPFGEHLRALFPSPISSEVIADYNDKNNRTYLLRWVLKQDQKKKLKKAYGGTTDVAFSRIGFNKDETEALVYVSWSGVGNTCESDFVHLKKESDKWTIVRKVMVVIC